MVKSCVDFGSNYPNMEVVQHFYNQLNVNVQSILYYQFDSFIASSFRVACEHTDGFRRVFHSLLHASCVRYYTHIAHAHISTYVRTFFLRVISKAAHKEIKKTSCAMPAKSLIYATRDIYFYRKIAENRNYSEHLFPSSL